MENYSLRGKMKAFKIKKRTIRQPTFIIGPSVGSFPKPRLPKTFITKIHKPSLMKELPDFQIIVESKSVDSQQAVVESKSVDSQRAVVESVVVQVARVEQAVVDFVLE